MRSFFRDPDGHLFEISEYRPDLVAEPIVPLFDSGRPDLASRTDELLDGFGED